MSSRKYTWNAFASALDGAVIAGATTFTLDSTTNLRAPGYLVIDPDDPAKREYVSFTAVDGLNLTGVTRNLGGSVGDVGHDSGAVVRGVMMHQFIDDLFADIEALETADTAHAAAGDPHPVYLTQAEGDARYVDVAGDTMTGNLSVGNNKITNSAAPTADNDLARKKYVDDADALRLALTGGTLSGGLNMGSNKITQVGDPTANKDAAHKKYVDDAIAAIDVESATRMAHVKLNSGQTISDATLTYVPWDAADYDPGGWWSAGTPTRITVPTAGLYVVTISADWAASANGFRRMNVRKNGVAGVWEFEDYRNAIVGGGVSVASASNVLRLAANDYLEMGVRHNHGTGLVLAAPGTHFKVVRIKDLT